MRSILYSISTILLFLLYSCESFDTVEEKIEENTFENFFLKVFDNLWIETDDINFTYFDHEIRDSRLYKSILKRKYSGIFGNNISSITHSYDEIGRIKESSWIGYDIKSKNIITKYSYYDNSTISKIEYYIDDNLFETRNYFYDNSNNFNKVIISNDSISTYYILSDKNRIFEYSYKTYSKTFNFSEDKILNMVVSKKNATENSIKNEDNNQEVNNEKITYTFNYDSNNNLSKISSDNNQHTNFEYTNSALIKYNYVDTLEMSRFYYDQNYTNRRKMEYNYASSKFNFCKETIMNSEKLITRINYYEGSIKELVLLGYSIIESRNKDNIKTKETIYNNSFQKLYCVDYIITDKIITSQTWRNAFNDPINFEDIEENWVKILVE